MGPGLLKSFFAAKVSPKLVPCVLYFHMTGGVWFVVLVCSLRRSCCRVEYPLIRKYFVLMKLFFYIPMKHGLPLVPIVGMGTALKASVLHRQGLPNFD